MHVFQKGVFSFPEISVRSPNTLTYSTGTIARSNACALISISAVRTVIQADGSGRWTMSGPSFISCQRNKLFICFIEIVTGPSKCEHHACKTAQIQMELFFDFIQYCLKKVKKGFYSFTQSLELRCGKKQERKQDLLDSKNVLSH